MNKQKLKEEAKARFPLLIEEQADWWLSKLEQSHKELESKIKQRLSFIGEPEGFSENASWAKGAKEAFEGVLSFINSNNKRI